MMRILAVDTSTMSCSVSVLDSGLVIAEKTLVSKETHSKHLHEMIERVLDMADLDISDVDGFAVTKGPGSFTGLRIGVSAIKGLAFALNKPVVAVSSLEALAWPFCFSSIRICPMIDARRGEVYTAQYVSKNGMLEKIIDDSVLSPEKVVADLKDPALFIGSGALAYQEILTGHLGASAHFVPPHMNVIRAAAVGELGFRKFGKRENDDVHSFKPRYIRKSDAELNFAK
ncbi:MAG: tRNA (adenosine(37)-N6)-threonylcarbamoyltransferase complex dimerization subunit type 1 TsaB [Proteobacteria bacterium]|nr:tRNA (adenosine(37)-N6)-threonylcarbamoyltransferase complex dimerization subunit type 1 TsaB [Pseudomonadota bacterium]